MPARNVPAGYLDYPEWIQQQWHTHQSGRAEIIRSMTDEEIASSFGPATSTAENVPALRPLKFVSDEEFEAELLKAIPPGVRDKRWFMSAVRKRRKENLHRLNHSKGVKVNKDLTLRLKMPLENPPQSG